MDTKVKQPERNGSLTVCRLTGVCIVKKCVHRDPHPFSDACKGMCKHMGYAECRRIKN